MLGVHAARKGIDAPADVVMEIEDLRAEIAALEQGERLAGKVPATGRSYTIPTGPATYPPIGMYPL